jgi:fructokinase
LALASVLGDGAEVFFPAFDRARDISVAGAGVLSPECDTVIIEGNYLLYDAPIWRDLHQFWDFSVFLDIPEQTLEQRLVARWLAHGLSAEAARERARSNDLRNAGLMAKARLPADVVISL